MTPTTIFTLIVYLLYPTGTVERTMRPVQVDTFKECLHVGHVASAKHWGHVPGLSFRIECYDENGVMQAEGNELGGGHPGLSFRRED